MGAQHKKWLCGLTMMAIVTLAAHTAPAKEGHLYRLLWKPLSKFDIGTGLCCDTGFWRGNRECGMHPNCDTGFWRCFDWGNCLDCRSPFWYRGHMPGYEPCCRQRRCGQADCSHCGK